MLSVAYVRGRKRRHFFVLAFLFLCLINSSAPHPGHVWDALQQNAEAAREKHLGAFLLLHIHDVKHFTSYVYIERGHNLPIHPFRNPTLVRAGAGPPHPLHWLLWRWCERAEAPTLRACAAGAGRCSPPRTAGRCPPHRTPCMCLSCAGARPPALLASAPDALVLADACAPPTLVLECWQMLAPLVVNHNNGLLPADA